MSAIVVSIGYVALVGKVYGTLAAFLSACVFRLRLQRF